MNTNLQDLIVNASKIYDIIFTKLMPLEIAEKQNSEEFTYYVKALRALLNKEKRLTTDDICLYDEFDIAFSQPFETIETEKGNHISRRINYLIQKIDFKSSFDFIFEILEEDEPVEYNFNNDLEIEKNVYLDYLAHTAQKSQTNKGLIKQKYMIAFEKPDISYTLAPVNFNANNIIGNDLIRAEFLGITEEEYELEKDEILTMLAEEYINRIPNELVDTITVTENDTTITKEVLNIEKADSAIELVKFFADNISEENKDIIAGMLDYEKLAHNHMPLYNETQNIFEIMLDAIGVETKIYGLTSEEIEDNIVLNEEEIEYNQIKLLKEKDIETLFELAKLENEMHYTITQIAYQKMANENPTQELQTLEILTEQETNLTNKLKHLTSEELITALSIVENHLDIITGENINIDDNPYYYVDFDSEDEVTEEDMQEILNQHGVKINVETFLAEIKELLGLTETDITIKIRYEKLSKEKENLIVRRLNSLLSKEENIIFPAKKAIYENLEIKVIQKYEKIIESTKENAHLIMTEYEEIFASPSLTSALIASKGKISYIDPFDDEIIAALYQIDEEEVYYDKQELLHEIAKFYMEFIAVTSEENMDLAMEANRILQKVFLEEAISQLDKWHYSTLATQYSLLRENNIFNKNKLDKMFKKSKTMIKRH